MVRVEKSSVRTFSFVVDSYLRQEQRRGILVTSLVRQDRLNPARTRTRNTKSDWRVCLPESLANNFSPPKNRAQVWGCKRSMALQTVHHNRQSEKNAEDKIEVTEWTNAEGG